MAADAVLVVDAGSSSLRCHLADFTGRVIASAARRWEYMDEPDAPELARAFNPRACLESVRDATRQLAGRDIRIRAVAITSQRQSLAFLDDERRVLYAGPNTDLRAVFEGAALDDQHGDLIYATTGHSPSFLTAPGKLAWFKERRPEDYARIAHVLPLADWLAFELTGELACEPSLASECGLLDVASRMTASDMFGALDIHCPTPPLSGAFELRGRVSEQGLGVLAGTPVVSAGADTQCGLIGMGVVEPGDLGIVAGWSATAQILASAPILASDAKTWTGCFQRPDVWTVEGNAGDVGNVHRWIAGLLFPESSDAYRRMDEEAAAVPVGADGVAGHLGPREMNAASLGMNVGGLLFPVPMTLGAPSRGQLARAALESFAYALRANLELVESVVGGSARRVAVGGGMSRSPVFVRILADALGREIDVSSEPEATVRGAALAALVATGHFASLYEATALAANDCVTLQPDSLNAAEYDELYQRWTETQRSLGELPA